MSPRSEETPGHTEQELRISLEFLSLTVLRFEFPSLVASILSFLVMSSLSTSSFFHVIMNLRPPSVTVSPHTSAFNNAVAFQCPVMPNSRMSLCTQSVHSLLPTPSSPHLTLKVSEHHSLWQSPAAHSDELPHPQKKSSLII